MACEAVIFDLDGTLVDTLEDLSAAMNYGLATLGEPEHTTEESRRMIGNGVRTFVRRALAVDKQHLQDELLIRMKKRYSSICLEQTRIYDGMDTVVEKLLAMGLRLAVMTNKEHNDAVRIVEHFFGKDTFKYIYGIAENIAVKPDPAATMKIIEKMGIALKNFIFVGDSDVDIQTARAVNIRSVGVTWGFRSREELINAGADLIIDKPAEILEIIAKQ